MHEPGLICADMFGQMGQECDDIVFGDGFDFVNPGHIEVHIAGFPDGCGMCGGDNPKCCLRVAGVGLNLEPDFEFGFSGPDRNHIGAGIAGDHRRHLLWVGQASPAS